MERREATAAVTRGVRRRLAAEGFEALLEFTPTRGLRADLFAMSRKGALWIVEVKSGWADYQADGKWRGYADWCDRFYFAVDADFPLDRAPEGVGLMRADAYGAEIVREAAERPVAAARRRSLALKFAVEAAARVRRLEDPDAPPAL